jgi:hypothetical protein
MSRATTHNSQDPNVAAAARLAFRLGFFLLADRKDALSVLHQAVARLPVTAHTQKKRLAKRPKNEVHKKLSLTELQLLQYLVYVCSELYERMQEQEHRDGRRSLTQEDMIARYVKHLVLLYLEHNSFYAAVGQSCVLFDLETSQAERLYEILVQGSPAHLDTKGDYSVRDAKREMRQRLADRFGPFVSSREGARREQRLVTMADPGPHFGFVKRCLHRLQPVPDEDGGAGRWHLPSCFDPTAYGLTELQHDAGDSDPRAEQSAELRRLHAVVHPCCWARLLRAAGHAYGRRRLLLPSFNLSRDGDTRHMRHSNRHPPELTSDELDGLSRALSKEARRRSALSASDLSVAVDDVPCRLWSPGETDTLRVSAGAGARVLSVSGRDEEGEVLLAVCLLQFGDVGDGGGPFKVKLEGGRELTFEVTRTPGGPGGFEVLIRLRETRPHRAAASYLARRYKGLGGATLYGWASAARLKFVALTCAALLAALLVGWWLTRAPRPTPPVMQADRQTPTLPTTPLPSPAQTQEARKESGTAEQPSPGNGGAVSPPALHAPSPPAREGQGGGRTPQATRKPRRRPTEAVGQSAQGGEIVRGRGQPSNARRPEPFEQTHGSTRGTQGDGLEGVGLADVREVYVDPLSGSPLGEAMRRHLSEAVGGSGGLSLTPERLKADAILVGEIEETAGRLTLDVRLVNVRGRVLWRERLSLEKGAAEASLPDAAKRMIGGLLRRIKAEARRE